VVRANFEHLSREILERLATIGASNPIDGLWYDIHRAICVKGMEDIESELLRRIRSVIGSDILVSTSMDLHRNVSKELAHQTDLITCYRMAPHEDALETKERACRNLIDILTSRTDTRRRRPLKA
jgi:microcystin degradation protein MlrC